MFSVRVFFAVAGALLISNAAQAKATRRLDCNDKDANICVYFEVAKDETQKAYNLLNDIQQQKLDEAKEKLRDAERDFEKLLKGEENPMQDLENALSLLVSAFETVENNCKNGCKTVLTHIGKATVHTVSGIDKVLTDAEKKQKIGDLYKQYFGNKDLTEEEQTENAYLFGGEVLDVLLENSQTESEDN